uniref:Uncharacterized protein n=1 Tax=Anguilla anguilla TaxID=7936 RepID=A0A0E9VWK0_ANGAN
MRHVTRPVVPPWSALFWCRLTQNPIVACRQSENRKVEEL